MIATGDHQHAKLCAEVVTAGKDCYVEKPFANVLSEAKAARAAVKASKQIVQMEAHRSQPYPLAVRDLIRSGRIGDVVKIAQEWNVKPAALAQTQIPHGRKRRRHRLETLAAGQTISAVRSARLPGVPPL